jgi:NAD(P)H dehydrogenase (quinone)
MSIAITGATGQLGRLVIADLLAAGVPAGGITAVARDEGKAADLVADEHRETEQLILDSGLPYTFLRNNWYSDAPMYVADLPGIVERGAIVAAGSRIATAPRTDYAAAAAVVVNDDGHLNTAYELGGDTAWSFEEFAAEISRQTGTKVVHTSVTAAEHRALLTGAGLPGAYADILVDVDDAISRGMLSATPGDLRRLVGRPTTPIAATIAAALAP